MKAVIVERNNKVGIWDIPEPKASDYQAKVKVIAGSLCNSTDTKILHGEFAGPHPVILGHEVVGEVVETGSKVRMYKKGDLVVRPRVTAYPELELGTAFGSFVEYGLVTDEFAREEDEGSKRQRMPNQTRADPSWDPLALVQTITLKETLSFLKNLGVEEGDAILIFGTGPVGLSFSIWARHLGCDPVIVVGRRDEACRKALDFGRATHVINNQGENVVNSVRRIAGEGVKFSIEAIGENAVLRDCLECLKTGGEIGIYGVSPNSQGKSPLLQDPRVSKARPDEGAVDQEVLEAVKKGLIPAREFVTHELKFEECEHAFQLLAEKKAFKIGFSF